jgi:transposase
LRFAGRRIKATRKQLYDALHGRLTDHHRFILRLHSRQYDALAEAIAEIDQQVDAAIAKMDNGGGGRSGHLSHPGRSTAMAAILDQDGGADATRFLSFANAVASFS